MTSGLGIGVEDVVTTSNDNDLRSREEVACRPAWGRSEQQLAFLVTLWPCLSKAVRQAILILAEATAQSPSDNRKPTTGDRGPAGQQRSLPS